eukprot:2840786-Prymnesium_polylepis.2
MLTVTAVTQRLRHRWRALGYSATASERELVSPSHSGGSTVYCTLDSRVGEVQPTVPPGPLS